MSTGWPRILQPVPAVDFQGRTCPWFIDDTPSDDLEFGVADHDNPAAGEMDLLTAVMHELGHVLGLDHVHVIGPELMSDALVTGVRRLPLAGEAAGLKTAGLTSVALVLHLADRIPWLSWAQGRVVASSSFGPAAGTDGQRITFARLEPGWISCRQGGASRRSCRRRLVDVGRNSGGRADGR